MSNEEGGPADLGSGSVSDAEKKRTEFDLAMGIERRWMRRILFGVYIVLVAAYLFCLLWMIGTAFWYPCHFLSASSASTHAAVLTALVLIIMTTVPLSLAMALRKLASDPSTKDDDDGMNITTHHLEFLKMAKELFGKKERD